MLGIQEAPEERPRPTRSRQDSYDLIQKLSGDRLSPTASGANGRQISEGLDQAAAQPERQLTPEANAEEDWWGTATASNGAPTSPANADGGPLAETAFGQDAEELDASRREPPPIPLPSETEEVELKAKALRA